MKATVDIPDQLYRQVKARSAIEGRAIRDVTIELYQRWLAEAGFSVAPTETASPESTIASENRSPMRLAGWRDGRRSARSWRDGQSIHGRHGRSCWPTGAEC